MAKENPYRRRKCSEFYCLNVIMYPDKIKGIGKFTKGKSRNKSSDPKWAKVAQQLAQTHYDFKSKLMEYIFGTGKDYHWFWVNYMCFTDESIREFLEIWYNIRVGNHEGYYQYLVPVEHIGLIDWMKNNKPLHSVEPTRYRIEWMSWMHQEKNFHFAEKAIEFAKSQRKDTKSGNWPALEILTDKDKRSLC